MEAALPPPIPASPCAGGVALAPEIPARSRHLREGAAEPRSHGAPEPRSPGSRSSNRDFRASPKIGEGLEGAPKSQVQNSSEMPMPTSSEQRRKRGQLTAG